MGNNYIKIKLLAALWLALIAFNSASATENVVENATIIQHETDAKTTLNLITESQILRGKLPEFITSATQAIESHNGALPASYANTIINTLSLAEQQRNGLFNQALKHRSALYRVDNNINDTERLNEIIISMSAAVTLFENNQALRKSFAKSYLLRKKLNEGYPEFGISSRFYDSSMTRSTTPEYVKNMSDAVHYFNDNKALIAQQVSSSTPNIQALYRVIATSPILSTFKGSSVFKEIALIPVKLVDTTFHLSTHELGRVKFRASQVTGNTMGMVRWRAGKLKNDKVVLAAMLSQLQPGDILLEKTPFTLTDKSIPGHFGHAAIYTGTAEQLKAIGAEVKPIIAKQMGNIAKGRGVVEALRSGVQLNSLQDFMNIDDVAILRLKNITPAQQIEIVNLAIANLGKKYDFNFDVNTTDTIVCSELVYIAYPQVDFVTKNVLGSFTVSPDDIALRAGGAEADPLQLVLFAHSGKLVVEVDTSENRYRLYDSLVKPNTLTASNSVPKKQAFEGFLGH